MAEIEIREMVKRFETLVAVNNLDLTINNKEFMVLLGPSGCGKTTTLRCISGLDVPDEGNIFIDGRDVTTKRASDRDIAFVFQLYALYPHLTAYENMAFPLKAQRYGRKQIQKEIERAAQILQIQNILSKKPKELSGGDMQRVALGRAIVRRPKAFLLDEPIGTLDAKFREEMRIELKKLHVDIEATTVYVTHDQVEAMSMGDRIAIMRLGVLQQIGTPHEIYSEPNNLFVANFIGSPGMNLIECKAVKDGQGKLGLLLKAPDFMIPIPEKLQKTIVDKENEGKDLVLGVRPEDVILSFEPKNDFVKNEVYVIEAMGSYNIIDFKFGGTETVRVRSLPDVKPNVGTEAYISFDMDRITLFDKKSEQSITK